MGNRLQLLKTKIQLGLIKLFGLSAYVNEMIESKDCEIRMLRINSDKLQKKYEYVAGEFEFYKHKALATISERIELDYTKITGEYPVLVIKANNSTPIDQNTFSRIRHHIGQACPKIDLIMFLRDDMTIEELSDEQLKRAGLRRIANE